MRSEIDYIEVEIEGKKIEIDGLWDKDFSFRSFIERVFWAFCWWSKPKVILRNPRIFYRFRNGELWLLEDLDIERGKKELRRRKKNGVC